MGTQSLSISMCEQDGSGVGKGIFVIYGVHED